MAVTVATTKRREATGTAAISHVLAPGPLESTDPGAKGALVYGILQGFASLEARHITRLDLNGLTRARVATGACSTLLDSESSEANQRNLTTGFQSTRDGADECIYSPTSISL